jgi:hypothetical protein
MHSTHVRSTSFVARLCTPLASCVPERCTLIPSRPCTIVEFHGLASNSLARLPRQSQPQSSPSPRPNNSAAMRDIDNMLYTVPCSHIPSSSSCCPCLHAASMCLSTSWMHSDINGSLAKPSSAVPPAQQPIIPHMRIIAQTLCLCAKLASALHTSNTSSAHHGELLETQPCAMRWARAALRCPRGSPVALPISQPTPKHTTREQRPRTRPRSTVSHPIQ